MEEADRPWHRINAISGLIAAVGIPLVLALVGHLYTNALKEREIQSRFVELALNILKELPSENNRNLRDWALKVVNKYSGVPLGAEAQKDLVENISLPTQNPAPRSTGLRVHTQTRSGDVTKVA